jgi:hypothetical protein
MRHRPEWRASNSSGLPISRRNNSDAYQDNGQTFQRKPDDRLSDRVLFSFFHLHLIADPELNLESVTLVESLIGP